jgi:tellurite resistance protein TerC
MIALPWILFIGLVLALLALDLGVFNREAHVVSVRESLAWTAIWIAIALGFAGVVYGGYERHWWGLGHAIGHELDGKTAALQYVTGYVIEKSLSLDNIFVIALIFHQFRVPPELQHRCLFWGILGALVMRGTMIAAGSALIARFDWMMYVFGGLLLYTAVQMLRGGHEDVEPDRQPLVRLARRLYPVTARFDGSRFFTAVEGRTAMTPLFLALLAIEGADVVFAVDSIPAIFAVTVDPFLVFTSNIFAILGLRALYFTLAAAIHRFTYMSAALSVLLAYIGAKMLLVHHYPIPTWISLLVIAAILSAGVGASLARARRGRARWQRQGHAP